MAQWHIPSQCLIPFNGSEMPLADSGEINKLRVLIGRRASLRHLSTGSHCNCHWSSLHFGCTRLHRPAIVLNGSMESGGENALDRFWQCDNLCRRYRRLSFRLGLSWWALTLMRIHCKGVPCLLQCTLYSVVRTYGQGSIVDPTLTASFAMFCRSQHDNGPPVVVNV